MVCLSVVIDHCDQALSVQVCTTLAHRLALPMLAVIAGLEVKESWCTQHSNTAVFFLAIEIGTYSTVVLYV